MVPWDVIDATATRVANDQSSEFVEKFGVFDTNLMESMLSVGDDIDGGICEKIFVFIFIFILNFFFFDRPNIFVNNNGPC